MEERGAILLFCPGPHKRHEKFYICKREIIRHTALKIQNIQFPISNTFYLFKIEIYFQALMHNPLQFFKQHQLFRFVLLHIDIP
jgi:hypothetical protein